VLVVEESTIRTHGKRILMKLDLRDHVQAVIFVYENELNQPFLQDGTVTRPPRVQGVTVGVPRALALLGLHGRRRVAPLPPC
jgi:hypothetical protein